MGTDNMVVLDDSEDVELASGLAGHDSGVRFSSYRTKDDEANNSISSFSHGTREEGITVVPDCKVWSVTQTGPAFSITTPRPCSSVDSEVEATPQIVSPIPREKGYPPSSQHPLKLILVDSRRFCKTRRKRPHFLGIPDKTSESFLFESPLHQCTCSTHPAPTLPSNIARDCDSCVENSDDEYDDTIHAPAIRRRARKRLRRQKASAVGREEKGKTSKKHTKLVAADLEIISGSSPTNPRSAKVTPGQILDKALERLDWNAATTALAGIQVQCQRLLADKEALMIPGARQKIQQGVADSLRAYWTQLLKQSLADIS